MALWLSSGQGKKSILRPCPLPGCMSTGDTQVCAPSSWLRDDEELEMEVIEDGRATGPTLVCSLLNLHFYLKLGYFVFLYYISLGCTLPNTIYVTNRVYTIFIILNPKKDITCSHSSLKNIFYLIFETSIVLCKYLFNCTSLLDYFHFELNYLIIMTLQEKLYSQRKKKSYFLLLALLFQVMFNKAKFLSNKIIGALFGIWICTFIMFYNIFKFL